METGISYSGNRYPEHFKRDLEDIVAHGCTYVVHCYSENDLVYSQKAMGRLFKMTRDAGLGCWADPWGLMKLFGGETFSTFVAHYPDACQVLNNGKRVPAACPSAPETLWTMRLWLDEVISSGATMIFWDEPHLYIPGWDEIRMAPDDTWGCRCPRCRQLFKDEYGSEMPEKITPEVKVFRQKTLLKFTRHDRIRQLKRCNQRSVPPACNGRNKRESTVESGDHLYGVEGVWDRSLLDGIQP